MIYKIFSVYDSKVGAFHLPFPMRSRGEALRSWTEVCNDSSKDFNKFAGDYTLFEIATFDDDTATYAQYDAKVSLGTALEFVKV